ncbi:HNH endonuclease [Acinetobacter boissieri]|uniref:5-methylcytosine-specific restriction enzyme A n=1 Tax=Acinetobacter boissieri TaxID=1219383 RepID=A0A1G6IUR4_9GAMM|nr:HNH endonuclease [Acinetobacter boissieri]SDC10151.1 5-methylcytosine-specific restriction enzyme A [Acinetobacter boissieri]
MANWLITCNYQTFNLEKAYDELSEIYWKNDVTNTDKGFQVGDIVYIYITAPISKIVYQFKVIEHTPNDKYPSAQLLFWKNLTDLKQYRGNFSVFKKLKKVDNKTLTRQSLIEQNYIKNSDTLQGLRTDRGKSQDHDISVLLNYITSQFNDEMIDFDYPDEANLNDKKFPEGAKQIVQVNRYERNPEARSKCIQHYGLSCQICKMEFAKTYGAFAQGFIHVHHITPLHKISDEYEVDPINDLIPVCPNCHAMLHKTINGTPMTIEKLKMLYQSSNNK